MGTHHCTFLLQLGLVCDVELAANILQRENGHQPEIECLAGATPLCGDGLCGACVGLGH